MEFKFFNTSLTNESILVISMFESEKIENILTIKFIDNLDNLNSIIKQVNQVVSTEAFQAKTAKILSVPLYGLTDLKKIIIYGLGDKTKINNTTYRKFGANLARLCFNKHLNLAVLVQTETINNSLNIQTFTEGFILSSYKFEKYKQIKEEKQSKTQLISFYGDFEPGSNLVESTNIGLTIASAVNMAKNLINEPAINMTPVIFADYAQDLALKSNLNIEILTVKEMKELNMNCILAVGQGSKNEPRFVVLRYQGENTKMNYGLAGKGITFDSGGLSLKPPLSMEYMKYDMSGAAIVLAVMQIVAWIKPKFCVTAVMPLAENMPGGNALRPGDVIKSMSGKTIEVNNTDAEGRLVLADALYYLQKLGVSEIIDIATLTGGVLTALGRASCGVMSNNQDLCNRINSISNLAGEKVWQLPLFEEYKEGLKSDIADLKNAGSRGEAATSSAASFLQEFVNDIPWLHFDIANVGWSDKDKEEITKGPTAYGARLIAYYLIDQNKN